MLNKNTLKAKIRIKQWWIDYFSRPDYWFCAVVEINGDEYQYIERKLEDS